MAAEWPVTISGCWQERETGGAASQEQPVDTSRAAEFPNLLEASLADDHPDLFKYISNVQDLVSSLRLGERRLPDTPQARHSLTPHIAVNLIHCVYTLSPFRWNMIPMVLDWACLFTDAVCTCGSKSAFS